VLRLEGTKIVLRGGRNKDIAPLYGYICDPFVQKYLALKPPPDIERFGERLREWMSPSERDYYFVIATKADNAAIGLLRLHWNTANVGELSFWIGRWFWGKGYAAEAAGKAGIFAFTELGLDSLVTHVLAGNARALSLVQKLGFEAVGAHRLDSDEPLKGQEIILKVDRHGFLWVDPAMPGEEKIKQ